MLAGLATVVAPFFAGISVFLNPLRRRVKSGNDAGAAAGFLKVALLDSLPDNQTPRRFEVIDDLVDAWNIFPQEPVGAVYLVRDPSGQVKAFNVDCPHAGCSVDFHSASQKFKCPCHDSSFEPADGAIANPASPSPRGLDELETTIKEGPNGKEIWVRYQKFQAGTKEKKVIDS
jgi:menaquinol-cytochrome c reductase iron-sulfur subunit